MKKYRFLTLLFFLTTIMSCEPRIEMNMAQWGDTAFITNVQLFKLDIDDNVQLQEYYNTGQKVTGVRKIIISASADIDEEAATVYVALNEGETLDSAGILIYHRSVKVKPLSNTPKAGVVTDLSSGQFSYRLISADGTHRDWTIFVD